MKKFVLCLCSPMLLASLQSLHALTALTSKLRCEAHFFEAHFNYPDGYDKRKDQWLMSESMHKAFTRAPLSSYPYFRRTLSEVWHLTLLKPIRMQFPFLQRYEITYLEARATGLGQILYRFEHKVNHLKSVEFTLDMLDPVGFFIQHSVSFDQYLHLTCSPE